MCSAFKLAHDLLHLRSTTRRGRASCPLLALFYQLKIYNEHTEFIMTILSFGEFILWMIREFLVSPVHPYNFSKPAFCQKCALETERRGSGKKTAKVDKLHLIKERRNAAWPARSAPNYKLAKAKEDRKVTKDARWWMAYYCLLVTTTLLFPKVINLFVVGGPLDTALLKIENSQWTELMPY